MKDISSLDQPLFPKLQSKPFCGIAYQHQLAKNAPKSLLIGTLKQFSLDESNCQTIRSRLTFYPDITVSLKVVVSSFPRIAIMTQQCDRWPWTHRDISYTFFI